VLAVRLALVVFLLLLVMVVFWFDRDGMRDHADGVVSPGDIVYFTVVTVTTVGYGDIVPVSDRARMIDALFVTPVRMLVWFIFLGTAYELLLQRIFEDLRMHRLQRKLAGHIIVCGYGSVGRFAAAEFVRQGRPAVDVVVIDSDKTAADQAAACGHTTLHGSASREEILELAGATRAAAIVVSMDSDATAALVVLTARELSSARIIVKIDEEENRKLMRRSGADQVLTLGALGGSLIADGVSADLAVEFVGDLVSRHGRVHLVQRTPAAAEVGRPVMSVGGLVMLRRGDNKTWCGREMQAMQIEAADQLLCIEHS
jgi:voltage-gated potassium channel